jgi:thiamine-phosphate pyrophosphorylase
MKIERLHYISQQTTTHSHTSAIHQALDAGCRWIQLRVKNTTAAELLPVAEKVKQLCDRYQARLVVNDYPTVAKAVEAYGVHLGLTDMPVKEARSITGPDMIIGGTANCFDDIRLRVEEGADYIGLGPFRFTTTKAQLSPILGLDGYRRLLQQMQAEGLSIPVIAIGGITPADVEDLLQTGIHGIALSGAITQAADQAAVVTALYRLLESACVG